MIERNGRVIAIHAETIDVQVDKPSACSQCGSSQSCHGNTAQHIVSLPLTPGLNTGDSVRISMEASTLNLSASLAYLAPALCLIAGAWIGDLFGTIPAIIGATLGLTGCLLATPTLMRLSGMGALQPALEACIHTPITKPQGSPLP